MVQGITPHSGQPNNGICVINCTTVNGPWLSVNACKATLFQQRLRQTLGGSDKNPKHGCSGGIFGLVPWLQVLATPHIKDGILGIQSFTVVPMGARTVGLLTEAQQWQVMYGYVPQGAWMKDSQDPSAPSRKTINFIAPTSASTHVSNEGHSHGSTPFMHVKHPDKSDVLMFTQTNVFCQVGSQKTPQLENPTYGQTECHSLV